jgi:ubiquinone biosynthesis protein
MGRVIAGLPDVLVQAEAAATGFAAMARSGIRLDPDTVQSLARGQARERLWTRLALWTGALALVALAVAHWMGN